jgi:ubiquinone/menaquinone biosynthesis C-methylase UbiE
MSPSTNRIKRELAAVASVPAGLTLQISEQLQQRHYDEISAVYDRHYNDSYSLEYRRRFIYEPMFEGLPLSNMNVLDAMCGTGQTTEYLLSKDARVTGLDISDGMLDAFSRRWPGCKAVRSSLLSSGLPKSSFDCVAVVGGLHHIQPNVTAAIHEIHRLLRPGGYFCFMEPHCGSLPDYVRRFWYKRDHFFSPNEASIDVGALETSFGSDFTFNKTEYRGNIAFLLVFNSLIFRVPLKFKPLYSPYLLRLERLVSHLQGKALSCFVVCQWQKKSS